MINTICEAILYALMLIVICTSYGIVYTVAMSVDIEEQDESENKLNVDI